MDRKALAIIILTVGLMLGWRFGYYAPRAEKQRLLYEALKKQQAEEAKAKQPAVADVAKTTEPGATNATAATTTGATPPPAPAATPSVPEERKTLASVPGTVDYEFTSQGGGIIRGTLREHFKDKTKGTQVIINEFGTIPIGAMTDEAALKNLGDQLEGDNRKIDAENPDTETKSRLRKLAQEKYDRDLDALIKLPWKMSVNDTDHTVSFERMDDARHIKITKTFFLPREKTPSGEYSVGLDVTFENVGEQAMMAPTLFVNTGSAAPVNASETRMYQGFDWWRDGTNNFHAVDWFSAGGILMWSHPERPVFSLKDTDLIRWVAVTNQYFTTMVTMLGEKDRVTPDLTRDLGVSAWAKRGAVSPDAWRA